MPKKPAIKLKPVKVQNVEIPLYRYKDGRTGFCDKIGGKRKIRAFTDESRARSEAEKVALRVMRGDTFHHELRTKDVDAFLQIRDIADAFEISPALAMDEWAQARRIAGCRNLLEVVRCGSENLSRPSKTLSEVMEAFLAAKRMAGVSSIYLAELTEDLTVFAKQFGDHPIASITTDDVQEWLSTRPVGPRRRNNLRATLVTLFKFAQSRQPALLPPGPTAPQLIQKAKNKRGSAITVYTPEEMRFWLAHVKEVFLPWLLIGGFSGIRTEEICPPPESYKDRLKWSDFNWKKGHINVRPEVAKTNERRLVPISENLMEWLIPYQNAHGPVIPCGTRTDREAARLSRFSKRLTEAAEKEPAKYHHPCPGLSWRHNALRHSAASYRMAIVKNAPQVAHEFGNSVPMIKKHYHEAQEEDVAKAYYSIRPCDTAHNIVQLNFGLL